MDNLTELKTIWRTARTDSLPGAVKMLQLIRRYRVNKLVKLAALTVIALLLIVILIRVVFAYKSILISTRIGEGLMILAGLILLLTQIRSFIGFYQAKDKNNKEFIRFLEHTRQQKIRYFKQTQVIALFLCSAGLLFYIFEAVYQKLLYCIVAYSLLTAYLLILAFVVRPRVFRRQDKKLTNQIRHFQALLKQIDQI